MLKHDLAQSPAALDDDALVRKVISLSGDERTVLVSFLRHLAEFDQRRLFAAQGYSSLYVYCRQALGLSEGSAFRRYTAARLMRRFPAMEDLLLDGRLTLARVVALKNVLTEENHRELLERATLGTERDVEVLAASLQPKPDISDGIRRLPSRTRAAASAAATSSPSSLPEPPDPHRAPQALPEPRPSPTLLTPSEPMRPQQASASAAVDAPTPSLFNTDTPHAPAPARAARMEVEATSSTAFSVRMRVSAEFLEEFEQVKAALSHKVPDGSFEAIFRECFRITLDAVQRRRAGASRKCGTSANVKAAATSNVRDREPASDASGVVHAATEPADAAVNGDGTNAAGATESSRYISAAVRRAVWARDDGRCAFVSKDGKRCGSTHQIEVHHIEPFARGGAATVENLSLRCRTHNRFEAEVAFGQGFIRSLPIWRCEDSAHPSLRWESNPAVGEGAVH